MTGHGKITPESRSRKRRLNGAGRKRRMPPLPVKAGSLSLKLPSWVVPRVNGLVPIFWDGFFYLGKGFREMSKACKALSLWGEFEDAVPFRLMAFLGRRNLEPSWFWSPVNTWEGGCGSNGFCWTMGSFRLGLGFGDLPPSRGRENAQRRRGESIGSEPTPANNQELRTNNQQLETRNRCFTTRKEIAWQWASFGRLRPRFR